MVASFCRGRTNRGLKTGITLVETLVIIGILSLLIGLLLPAVQAARESSRQFGCQNNLRQIGVALHSYASAWNSFPMSSMCSITNHKQSTLVSCYSAHVALLPYLDQKHLYYTINFSLSGLGLESLHPGNATAAGNQLAIFICPSDSRSSSSSHASMNSYRYNMGLCEMCAEQNSGAFSINQMSTLSGFQDGLSTTLAFSEKLVGSTNAPNNSKLRNWRLYAGIPVPKRWQSWVQACENLKNEESSFIAGGQSWMFPGGAYTWFFVSTPPNYPIYDCGVGHAGGVGIFTARSAHYAGVNALIADGSVSKTASSVNPEVWRSMGTRSGGEIVSGER